MKLAASATVVTAAFLLACTASAPPESSSSDVFSGPNPPPDMLGEADERIPGYEDYLRDNGIEEAYSPESEAELKRFVSSWLDRIEARRSEIKAAEERGEGTGELEDEDDDLKEQRRFLKHSLEMLEDAAAEGTSEIARVAAFHVAKRMTYVVFSMRPDREPTDFHERLRRRFESIENYTKVAIRHALREVQFQLPYLREEELDQPLGAKRAALEARFLADPDEPTRYLSGERLARMTPREVGALDISSSHPAWHTEAYSAEHPDGWQRLEAWVQQRLTKKLNKDHDLEDDFPDFSYRLAAARKVLFFDKLKDSASSPKIKGKDAFGINWKIKWGDEVQTEPVGNRLWMKLGGKYNDLCYVNGLGRDHLVLVLADPEQADANDEGACQPVTYDDLATCLIESNYEFNVEPYKYETGELSSENVAEILAHLPKEALKGYRKQDLIGRHYVTFRETLVEVDPPKSIVRRGGATSFSGLGARQDRVARALYLFNMWIWNQDAKDDNNRGLLLKNLVRDGEAYIETQHDMGVSLGGVLAYGKINQMKVGEAFARVVKKPSPKIFFRQHTFYHPRAWRDATYADGLWMARKLMKVSRADVEEVVAQTLWPDFMQAALTYKLMTRRNDIARLFHLDVPASDVVAAPDVEIPLATAEDRRAAAERYGLDPAWIEDAMREAGLLDRGYRDRLVDAGQISDCEDTILLGILQRHRHPSGLPDRVKRFFDDRVGDYGCTYGG